MKPLVAQFVRFLRRIDDFVYENHGPTRILFVATEGYGLACQLPVVRELLDHPSVHVRAVDASGNGEEAITFADPDAEALFRRVEIGKRAAAWSKWHLVVYSHLCGFYTRRNALKVYMHHGPGFGSGGGTAAAEKCEIYFGLSKFELDYLETRRPGLFDGTRAFFPVGFPKFDALVSANRKEPEEARRHLGLPTNRLILIVSSRNRVGLLPSLGAEPFRRIAEAFPDWTVVQTGHPWLWASRPDADVAAQQRLIESLRNVEESFPNARFLPDLSADVLVTAADLLVADCTSVVPAFGLLDRPIVYFDNPAVQEKSKLQWQPYRDASLPFGDSAEVVGACRAAVSGGREKHRERRALRERFFANAGRSAEVAAGILIDIGRVCSASSPKWSGVIRLSREPGD